MMYSKEEIMAYYFKHISQNLIARCNEEQETSAFKISCLQVEIRNEKENDF
jgi:hypothetical protein